MSARCPTCGQVISTVVSDDAQLLVDCLRRLGPRGQRRDAYRGDNTQQWFLTYGSHEGEPRSFSAKAVDDAKSRGWIDRTYPETGDVYSLREQQP